MSLKLYQKTMMETSKEANKALVNLNDKFSGRVKDRVKLASCLLSSLSIISIPEQTSQFKLVKDPDSNRINDLLINKTKPVTLYDNLLTLRDSDKNFQLAGDLLKLMANKNYNVDLAKMSDKKLSFNLQRNCTLMKKF